jgi:hypothetical protein
MIPGQAEKRRVQLVWLMLGMYDIIAGFMQLCKALTDQKEDNSFGF